MTSHETACRPDLLADMVVIIVNSINECRTNDRNRDQKEQKVVHNWLMDWLIGWYEPEKI
jgi:hypothetical protein